MYQRKSPRVGAPLHTREVFPEVSRSGERIDEKLPGTATSRHRQFPSIQFFFFFFSVSTRGSQVTAPIGKRREKRRLNGSLIIPLNGKPISRFVPRRLAKHTGRARDKREKLKNDVRLHYEERLCVYPLHDEVLRPLTGPSGPRIGRVNCNYIVFNTR